MYALWIKNTSESDPRSCEATKAVAKESPEKILGNFLLGVGRRDLQAPDRFAY